MFDFLKKKKEEESVGNDTPPPDIAIPDLKDKDEKEKKRGGIPLGFVQGKDAFVGARGAAGAASSAARSAASAAAGAGAGAGQAGVQVARAGLQGAGWLSRLLSTGAGKFAAASVAAIIVGVGAIAAINAMRAQKGEPTLSLGAIASGMKVDRSAATHTNLSTKGVPLAGSAPPAGPVPKAEEAGAAGDGGKADDQSKVETGAGTDTALRPTMPGDPTKALDGSRPGALATQLGGASFAMQGPQFGGALGKSIKKFDHPGSKARESSKTAKRDVLGSTKIGTIRNVNRNSKNIARLRGMAPFSQRMRSGGATAGEAHSIEALNQFEAQDTTGGQAPTGEDDPVPPVNPIPTTPPGGGCQCDWETQTCVAGACVNLSQSCGQFAVWDPVKKTCIAGNNLTPWEALAQRAKTIIKDIQRLMQRMMWLAIIGAIMAAVSYCSYGVSGIPFFAMGFGAAMDAKGKSEELMAIGSEITNMKEGAGGALGGDNNLGDHADSVHQMGKKLKTHSTILMILFGIATGAPLAGFIIGAFAAVAVAVVSAIVAAIMSGMAASTLKDLMSKMFPNG